MLRCLGLLAISATVLAFALPDGGAAQRSGGRSAGGGGLSVLFLRGSDGYQVQLMTIGRTVLLEAGKARVGAFYAVRGNVSGNRIGARFGRLGRVAVKFSPVGRSARRKRSSRCPDGGPPLEFGVFRGTIEFRGERGYTTVDARRASGVVIHPRRRPCGPNLRAALSATFGRPSLNTQLTAISRRKGTVTSFELSRRGRSRLSLEASRQERRGRMQIFRQASTVIGGENAFISSGPGVQPAFAFVVAPKPFAGSALFAADASNTWTGSLSAWLPGAGKVGLTGPDFALSLCRRSSEERGCNPEPPVRKPLWIPQGRGSQSQALREARLSWSRYRRNSASSAGSTP
jgi:hypothetical protein